MSRSTVRSWISTRAASGGIEWASAYFQGVAYSPHRHDTYAIGFTAKGVQSFGYRGESRRAGVGDLFVLHPDELHDGRQGTDEGYGYRIVYVSPELISDALGRPALPFVSAAVTRDRRLRRALSEVFLDPDDVDDDIFRCSALTSLADALSQMADGTANSLYRPDISRMRKVRDHLLEVAPNLVSSAALEREYGIDRFALARRFRATFGVSPHRFMTLRRLDRARREIVEGASLACAAATAGFADQSHMTRHFRNAYGLSPGVWRSLLRC